MLDSFRKRDAKSGYPRSQSPYSEMQAALSPSRDDKTEDKTEPPRRYSHPKQTRGTPCRRNRT
jgi:hypothetical protein